MDLTQASFDEKLTALFALSDSSLTFAISPLVSQSVLCTASLSCVTRYLTHEANVPMQSYQDPPTEIKPVFVLSYLKSRN